MVSRGGQTARISAAALPAECSSAGPRIGCGAGVHARTNRGCLAFFFFLFSFSLHPCVLACLGVYAPLSAGLSKCSPLTQNGSALPLQRQQTPENWGWGRGQGTEKNRDTFPLASPCAARALDRPREIGGGGGLEREQTGGAAGLRRGLPEEPRVTAARIDALLVFL